MREEIFTEEELQTAALKLLFDQRRMRPRTGGMPEQMIAAAIDISSNNLTFVNAIENLLAERKIERVTEREIPVLQITCSGIDHLLNYLPTINHSCFAPVLRMLFEGSANGVTTKLLMDSLKVVPGNKHVFNQRMEVEDIEFALWYCEQRGFIDSVEQTFKITDAGKQLMNTLNI